MTQPEVSMTPEAAMLLLDAAIMACPTVTGKASFSAIRAAVAELVKERDRYERNDVLQMERAIKAEQERDALRRRVEELETGAWLYGQRYYCKVCNIENYKPGECRHEHREMWVPSGKCVCKQCGAELSPERKLT